jgi:hypothetical protein
MESDLLGYNEENWTKKKTNDFHKNQYVHFFCIFWIIIMIYSFKLAQMKSLECEW